MAAVFVAFLVTGMLMPVLPLHVHSSLGFGTFVVGLVAGVQFAVSLASRFMAGSHADTRGARSAVLVGLGLAAAAGLFYVVSLAMLGYPSAAVFVLVIGRGLLGAAESFITTGALTWALAILGVAHTGKVIAWVGTAVWGAYAVGAPAGAALYAASGFTGIAAATLILPLLTLPLVLRVAPVAPTSNTTPSFTRVVRDVAVPGLGLALSSAGFGSITTFATLYFAERSWALVWLVFTALSGGFIVGRIALGSLPDRVGGAPVAAVSLVIEAIGLAVVWMAASPLVACTGALITGLGYSLVYPALGVEAVRRAPVESRGLAMGAYSAFFDLALGIGNPALGALAGAAGLRSVFGVAAVSALGGAFVAVCLMRSAFPALSTFVRQFVASDVSLNECNCQEVV
jgi:MFS family permease